MSERYRRSAFGRQQAYADRYRSSSSGFRQAHRAAQEWKGSRSGDRKQHESRQSELSEHRQSEKHEFRQLEYNKTRKAELCDPRQTDNQNHADRRNTARSPRSLHRHADLGSSRKRSHEHSVSKSDKKLDSGRDKTTADHKPRDKYSRQGYGMSTEKTTVDSKSKTETAKAITDNKLRDKHTATKSECHTSEKKQSELKSEMKNTAASKNSSRNQSENAAVGKGKVIAVDKDKPVKTETKSNSRMSFQKKEDHGTHSVKARDKKSVERIKSSQHSTRQPEKSSSNDQHSKKDSKRSKTASNQQNDRDHIRVGLKGLNGFRSRILQRTPGNKSKRAFMRQTTKTWTGRSATNMHNRWAVTHPTQAGKERRPVLVDQSGHQEHFHGEYLSGDRYSRQEISHKETFNLTMNDENEKYNMNLNHQRFSQDYQTQYADHRLDSDKEEWRQKGRYDREQRQATKYDQEMRQDVSYDTEKYDKSLSYYRDNRHDSSYDRTRLSENYAELDTPKAMRRDASYDRTNQNRKASFERNERRDFSYERNRSRGSYAELDTSKTVSGDYHGSHDYYEKSHGFNNSESYDTRYNYEEQADRDSRRYPNEREDQNIDFEPDRDRQYTDHEMRSKRSSYVGDQRNTDFHDPYQKEKEYNFEQNRNDNMRKSKKYQEQTGNFRLHQKGLNSLRNRNEPSQSLQHYRRTKLKILTNRFRTVNKNKRIEKYPRKPIYMYSNRREKLSKTKFESERHKDADTPKVKPQIDMGASGCVLREDRPYKDRQNEGFAIHMDPPSKRDVKPINQTEDVTHVDNMQHSMIIIPNQDGQMVDQYGNMIQLSSVGQGAPVPVQNTTGQEVIFIPLGGSSVLPENIIPFQQGGIPISFLPQFIPSDQVQKNITHSSNNFNRNEDDNDNKYETKSVTKKTLTSEQRSKLRSKLIQRRKENLVKEVEKKVMENLDRKSMDKKLKLDIEGKGARLGLPNKISKMDSKGQNVYEDVSDLEDVSEDERDEENLSDWEKVSVDEIELDANERRPKFRKQNEPRTFVQHSLIRRKLNVRRAPTISLNQSKNENKKGTEETVRNEKSVVKQPELPATRTLHSSQSRATDRVKTVPKVHASMYVDRVSIEHGRESSGDKRVFKAYTAKMVSEELKRIENEKIKTQENRSLSAISRKSNRTDFGPSNREPRPISPLQVTVRNNLYDKKENTGMAGYSEDYNEFDDSVHKGRNTRDLGSTDRYHGGNPKSHTVIRNRDQVVNTKSLQRDAYSDKRIICEKKHPLNTASDAGDQQKGNIWQKMVKRDSAQKDEIHDAKQKKIWSKESSRNEDRSRHEALSHSNKGDRFERKREEKFDPDWRKERNRNSSGKDDRKKGEAEKNQTTKDHQEPPSHVRDRRNTPPRFRENKSRDAGRMNDSDHTSKRFQDRVSYGTRDEQRLDQVNVKKRGFHKRESDRYEDEISPKKKMRDEDIHTFDEDMQSRRALGVESKVQSSASLEHRANQDATFDASLPPLQTMPPMAAPPAPPLPDMSLPPPLVRTQYAPTSQIVIQNPPLLGTPTQIQNVQQPQIIGLQPSQPMNSANMQQPPVSFQMQSAGMQHSFQQQALSQQSGLGIMQQPSRNQSVQFQESDLQQPQQQSYQIVIDHSQPVIGQLRHQQNVSSQQQQQQVQPQIIYTNVQQPQQGSLQFSTQLQSVNQPISGANQQQQHGHVVTNSNPFQNVQQTLNTLGINQGPGVQARIVSVGQNIIQGQIGGQPQQRGYLVPTSYSGNAQGYNKSQF